MKRGRKGLEALRSGKYISLTTYRRDGRAVATPIWFVVDGGRILAFTGAQTGKAKRIRVNPPVEIAPCTLKGAVTGPAQSGTACLLPDSEREHVMALIRAKYRVTKWLLDVIVAAIRVALRKPQTHSVYIEIRLDASASPE